MRSCFSLRRVSVFVFVFLSLSAAIVPPTTADDANASWQVRWSAESPRHWLGPQVWGNRLHDWQVKGDRLECLASQRRLGMRTAHLLTARLSEKNAPFQMEVQTGLLNAKQIVSHTSAVGFLVGVGGNEMDYRAAAIVHQWPGPGAGYFCGVTADGRAFIRDYSKQGIPVTPPRAKNAKGNPLPQSVTLRLTTQPQGKTQQRLSFEVLGDEGTVLAKAEQSVPAQRLIGNVALVSHPGRKAKGQTGRFWFKDWQLSGAKFKKHPKRSFGPIVGTQYTLSRGVLKLTAQMAPISRNEFENIDLQIKQDGKWKTIAKSNLIVPGWTAPFRVPNWDATKDVPYRVLCYGRPLRTIKVKGRELVAVSLDSWQGTIRKDPVDKKTITVAGFTGNHNNAGFIGSRRTDWKTGMFFPHTDITASVAKHKPDLLFFSGDQVYEGRSPTFADRNPANIKLDYMYKWYLWVWAYRDLTKDIPAITIPDDHDVYQGNLWGQGGRKSPGRDHHGGYVHPADFVKMVERTQTSHLPDPYDPTPVGQGIGVYYTHLLWGGISVAVIEDRKFKSGCARKDMPPSGTGRPDHFNDPDFDLKKLDIPGVQLLGKRQLKFLDDWGTDWRGAEMKLAVSQTIFANMATHHGGNLKYLIADLDSNGWPQSGRNRAVDRLRKCFAVHLAGDQHLATLVHHGIEEHGDAMWSLCVPSVANFYPRAWAPEAKGPYKYPEPDEFTGKRRDGFNHPVIVYAATNPGKPTGKKPAVLHDRMPGYGLVKFNKAKRSITFECWPRWADPANPKHHQYRGWPKTISQLDNYGRRRAGYLPAIKVKGMTDPVVQVVNEKSGEIVYTLRIKGTEFRPFVFEQGTYTVKVGELGTKRVKVLKGLGVAESKKVEIDLTASN